MKTKKNKAAVLKAMELYKTFKSYQYDTIAKNWIEDKEVTREHCRNVVTEIEEALKMVIANEKHEWSKNDTEVLFYWDEVKQFIDTVSAPLPAGVGKGERRKD